MNKKEIFFKLLEIKEAQIGLQEMIDDCFSYGAADYGCKILGEYNDLDDEAEELKAKLHNHQYLSDIIDDMDSLKHDIFEQDILESKEIDINSYNLALDSLERALINYCLQ
ncbi:MAG: hypothetical protein ACRDBY_08660 [Cetobacterium sp.]